MLSICCNIEVGSEFNGTIGKFGITKTLLNSLGTSYKATKVYINRYGLTINTYVVCHYISFVDMFYQCLQLVWILWVYAFYQGDNSSHNLLPKDFSCFYCLI